jgi:hypothetical protein
VTEDPDVVQHDENAPPPEKKPLKVEVKITNPNGKVLEFNNCVLLASQNQPQGCVVQIGIPGIRMDRGDGNIPSKILDPAGLPANRPQGLFLPTGMKKLPGAGNPE